MNWIEVEGMFIQTDQQPEKIMINLDNVTSIRPGTGSMYTTFIRFGKDHSVEINEPYQSFVIRVYTPDNIGFLPYRPCRGRK